MRCPFCDSEDVEVVAPWGGQIITRQVRCRSCNTYFEAIREEFESAPEEFESAPEEFESGPDEAKSTPDEAASWTTSSADDR